MQDIYDRTAFSPKDYRWNENGRSLAKACRRCAWAWYVVLLVLLCADLWWITRDLQGLSLGAAICAIVAVPVLYYGLSLATSTAFGNRSLRLSPEARHDYVLYLFHKARRTSGRNASRMLLLLAQLDVTRNRPDLARMALARIDTSLLQTERLKLYYLAQLAVHADDADSAQRWYDRYTGISEPGTSRFPADDAVRSWIGQVPNAPRMREAVASAATRPRRHAAIPALYGIMLAHCVFFLGVWLGVDQQAGWQLRIPYERVGGYLTSLFMVILAIVTLVLLRDDDREARGERQRAPRVAAAVPRIALALVVMLFAGYLALHVTASADSNERVVASGVAEDGRSYDYLAVTENSNGGTSSYRASDPILMERSSMAARYDDADSSEASSSTSGTTSQAPNAATRARQRQMEAVFDYLQGQGTLADMSLSFGADADGTPYALVSTGTEDVDGTSVTVEHRLYDDGEAMNDLQVVQEEFVLEKCYPNGERDRELEGFYLVDMVSLEVTDEHRTTW